MVAIVTGAGAGLERSSGATLGSQGQVGTATLGQGGDKVAVNATNGNLVIQSTDEMLIGLGLDDAIINTYNSSGTFTSNGWQESFQRSVTGLTGTVDTAGSTITRVAADGSEVVYTYNSSLGVYVGNEDGGAYDTLSFNASSNQWTWTEGKSQVTEVYDASNGGRLVSSTDASGDSLSYSYNASGQLAQITTADGDYTAFNYAGSLLTSITTNYQSSSGMQTETRVYYGYDSQGRLTTVTTDLSPGDNSIADGNTYVTTYGYSGSSNLITSITQSDGSSLQIGYNASGQVTSLTQTAASGVSQTTTLTYGSGQTTITDPLGNQTVMAYDANDNLTSLTDPLGKVSSFTWDSDGNVLSATSPLSETTSYSYDANGNLLSKTDAAGDATTYTYDARNQLLTATTNPTSGAPATTRYVYDAQERLAFEISATGEVTQYLYQTPSGGASSIRTPTSVIQYASAADAYNVSGLSSTQSPSLATMQSWAAGVTDLSTTKRTDTTYDARGQIASVTSYAQTNSDGTGAASSAITTNYVYDQAGDLLQKQVAGSSATEVYTYDGLGRVLTATDFNGEVTSSVRQYTSSGAQTKVTLANGAIETSVYNLAGELISYTKAGTDGTSATTTYAYDADGNLRSITDPTGLTTSYLYDADGRKVADIQADGAITEYGYNADGEMVSTVQYATKLTAAQLASLVSNGAPANVTLTSVTPSASANDRWSWKVYDAAGRLTETIDAAGDVTAYAYDGASNLISTTQYAAQLSASTITGFKAAAPTSPVLPAATAGADRVTRDFYDADGRLIGTLDPDGYLTQTVYDSSGQKAQTIAYATAASSSLLAAGTFAQLLSSVGTSSSDIHSWFVYDQAGNLRISVDGAGDVTRYDNYNANGQVGTVTTGQQVSTANLVSTPPTLSNFPAASGVLDVTNYAYDQEGHVLSKTLTLSGGVTETTTYAYDSVYNLVSETTNSSTTASAGADPRTQTKRYNALGQLVGELTGNGSAALAALGANPTQAQINAVWTQYGTNYAYDAAGRMTSQTNADGDRTLYYYDVDGRLTYAINPDGDVTQYGYDAFGDKISTTFYATPITASVLSTLIGGQITSALTRAITTSANDSTTQAAFNVTGTVADTVDAMGAETSYAYDAFGDVLTTTAPLQTGTTVQTAYTYDQKGQLLSSTLDSATGGLQLETAYAYDAFGRVISSTAANGLVTTTSYDGAGRMLSRTVDPTGLNLTTSWTYDGNGNVLSVTDATGATTSYAYTAFDRQVTVTDPNGVATTTTKNAYGQTVKVVDGNGDATTYAYDLDGDLTSTTDASGAVTTDAYDNADRLISVTDARGIVTSYSYDAAGRTLTRTVDSASGGLGLVTSWAYDGKGETLQVTDPTGTVTISSYDQDGRKLTQVVNPGGLALTTTWAYDEAGRLVSVTDPSGVVTQNTYDNAGRLTQSVIDPGGLNLTTQYTYDNAGNVLSKTDADGNITRYVYDSDNRLIFAVDALGDVVQSTYDADGRLTAERAYASSIAPSTLSGWGLAVTAAQIEAAAATSNNDRVNRYVYDAGGRLAYGVNAAGLATGYVYDGVGHVLQSTQFATPITAPPNGVYSEAYVQSELSSSANDRITRYAYDSVGRAAFSIDAVGAVTAYSYDADGQLAKTVAYATLDASSGVQSLAQMQTWASAEAGAGDRVTRTIYDAAGRTAYKVDAAGYVTQYVYDADGRLTSQIKYASAYSVGDGVTEAAMAALLPSTPPSSAHVTRYVYDAAGRLTDVFDPMGVQTHSTLDALGRVLTSTLAYGTSQAVTTQWVYDAAGRTLSQTSAYGTPEASTISYAYDAMGRKLTAKDGDGFTASYTYDALGHVLTVTDPLGAVTTTRYDTFGDKVEVTDPRGNSGYFYYDLLGRLTLQVDPAGYATATSYSLGGQVLQVIRYALPASNVGSVTIAPTLNVSARDETTVITRDALDRVVATTDANGYAEHYALDAFGDQVAATNKLGGVTLNTYDKRGLLLSETLPTSSTNTDGSVQLNSLTGTAAIINTYAYDAFGNKTQTVEAAGLTEARTTNYVYDNDNRLIAQRGDAVAVSSINTTTGVETTSTVTPTQTAIYDARGNVIETDDANGSRTLTYYDQLNRKIAQVDAAGTLSVWTYDANGNVLKQQVYDKPVTMPAAPGGAPPPPPSGATARETDYGYDADDRQISTTIANVRIGAYNGSSYVTSISNIVSTTTYDASGNIIKQTDGDGNSIYSFYDALNRKIAQVDQNNYLTTYALDQNGNVLTEMQYATALSTNFGAMSAAQLSSYNPTAVAPVTNGNDRVTTFTYDKNGQRLTETRENVAYSTISTGGGKTDAVANATITYTYNGLGEVTSKTEATGDATTYAYDLGGRQTSVTGPAFADFTGATVQQQTLTYYDGLGDVVRTTVGNAGAPVSQDRVTAYAYGPGGRLAASTDASGFTKTYAYDADGHVVRSSYVRVSSNGTPNYEAQISAYDGLGRVVFQTTGSTSTAGGTTWAFGDATETQYDAYGEVTAKGLNGQWQVTFAYDAAGRVWRSDAGDGTTKVIVYDAAGNATLTIASAGAAEGATGVDLSGYSLESALALLNNGVALNSAATAIDTTFVSGLVTTIDVFDARGQSIEALQPFRQLSEGGPTALIDQRQTYDAFGDLVVQTDARGNRTFYAYNALGEQTVTIAPAVNATAENGGVSVVTPTTHSFYDLSGRLVATEDANGNLTTQRLLAGTGYEQSGPLVVEQFYPDGGTAKTGYDVFHDARTLTNPLNEVETRTYDAMDRLISDTHYSNGVRVRIYGTSGADTFDNAGAGYEEGDGGADVFVFGSGYGQQEINENNGSAQDSAAVLQLKAGLTEGNIQVSSDAAGDMILTDGNGGDQIKVDNEFNLGAAGNQEYGVASVNFADGSSLTRQQLLALATTGSATHTSLFGSGSADTFDSKGFATYEQGRGGADTFIYNSGYGSLEINEDNGASSDSAAVLAFGAGITASQLTISMNTSGDLLITDGVHGDQVKLDGELNVGPYSHAEYGVASVSFADGTSLSRQQLIAMATPVPVGDRLYGTTGADIFDSKGYAAYAQGNGGTDTFIYNPGYKNLEINEDNGSSKASTAVLQMGGGLNAAQISVNRDSAGDMIITDAAAGDVVKVDGEFNKGSGGFYEYGVASIKFDDGSSLTFQQLLALAPALPARTTLTGTTGADTLDPAGTYNYIVGSGGADTLIFNSGYGHVEINEDAGINHTSPAVLKLGAGLSVANLSVSADSSGNLILTDGVNGDQITIDGELNTPYGYAEDGVASISFSDGTVLTRQQLIALATTGTGANTKLYGTSGADLFDGKGFATYAQGNGGADTFVYNAGYRQLEIKEDVGINQTSAAVLQLGSGIILADLSVTSDSSGDLIITDGITNDQITLDGELNMPYGYAEDGVATVKFSDGSSLTRQQLIALADTGSSSNTSLYGWSGAETFDSKGFATYEQGNGGADTFIYGAGYRSLEINENSGSNSVSSAAVLQMGAGITAANISVSADSSGNIYITDGVAGDQIKIDNEETVNGTITQYGVASVSFADGSSLSRQQLIALADTGSHANTKLYGTSGADIFDSKGSATYAQGNGGADTFVYNAGYRSLEINENSGTSSPTALLKMGAGITAANISISVDSSGNIYITDGVVGDQIKLDNEVPVNGSSVQYGVGTVSFADGSSITRQQLIALATAGSRANTSLYGTTGVDIFDSKGVATYAQGNGGADTFVYNAGYGSLEINETNGTSSPIAVLQMGAGITAANISVSEDSSGDIYLTDGVFGDQIKIDGEVHTTAASVQPGVASVNFADGTSLTRQQLIAFATTGSRVNTSLYGTTGADILDSRGVASYAQGNGGADTFVYNAGYGSLEVNENSGGNTVNSAAVLQVGAGITAANISVSADSSGALYLTDGVLGDRIKLDSEEALNGAITEFGVASVNFADGSSLTRQQLIALATTGSRTNTSLYGTSAADTFDSQGIAFYAQGNGGADAFIYNSGYGQLEISEDAGSGQTSAAVLQMGPGLTASAVHVRADSSGNLFLTDGVNRDQIELDKAQSSAEYGVASVSFADGSSLTRQQLLALAQATTTLTGTGGADTFTYNLGNGPVEIKDTTTFYNITASAALVFGAGITLGQLTVSSDSAGDMVITDGRAGDQITVDGEFNLGPWGDAQYGVAYVMLADGTTLTRQQLINLATTGEPGERKLYGTSSGDGPNVFDSNGYAAYEQGNGGADTFVYKAGYGQLEINEDNWYNTAASALIQFGPGITASQLVVTADSSGDLFITDGVAGDQIKIDNELNKGPWGVEEYGIASVGFADGSTLSRQQLIQMETAEGSPANIHLMGAAGADTFDSRGYATYEQGNGGADTFIYNEGYGSVEINENAGSGNTNAAVLQLGPGISASNLSVSVNSNYGLVLTDGVTGDKITLDNEMALYNSAPVYGVAEVEFADGTSLTRQQLVTLGTTGSPANTKLYGTQAADTFDGKGFATYEQGNGGADTFIYGSGYGKLEINESNSAPNTAVLQFGVGISATNLTVTADSNGNLYLADGVTGDQIKLDGELSNANNGVAAVNFSDGSSLSRQQLVALATTGSALNASLYGTSGADTFDSEGLASYEQGNGGADTFVYNLDYGQLEINESAGSVASAAGLLLGSGITTANLLVTSDSSGNIYLSDGVAGDQIKLDGEMNLTSSAPGVYSNGVASVVFADGSSLTRQQLINLALTGAAGNFKLYGASNASGYGAAAAETFDSKGVATYAQGNSGADTFVYNSGYGHLEINEDAGSGKTSAAVLQLNVGVTMATVDSSGNIYLYDGQTGDQIKLDKELTSAEFGVATIALSDGTTLTRQQLINLATAGSGTRISLIGSAGADTLDGQGYYNYLQGNGGADTFVFNSGYGALEINEDNGASQASTAVLQLGAGLTAANLTAFSDSSGNLYINDGVTGDQIKIDGELDLSPTGLAEFGVSEVKLADGTVLTRQQLINMATTGSKANPRLYGTAGADTFDGKGLVTYLQGNGGADTFIYNSGYGQEEINEDTGTLQDSAAVLQLGAGITSGQITVTRDAAGDAVITDGRSKDQIKIDGEFNVGADGHQEYGVAEVTFADGTTLTRQQLSDLASTLVGPTGVPYVPLTDVYAYDGLGEQILHTNSELAPSVQNDPLDLASWAGQVKETTDYDKQGRIISHTDFDGHATTYSYTYNAGLQTAGLGTFGGWTKTTTNSAGLTEVDQLDYYGRTITHQNYGGVVFTDTYDLAGRMVSQTSTGGAVVDYTYYNTGNLARQYDPSSYWDANNLTWVQDITSSYSYDVNGNRTYEGYWEDWVSYPTTLHLTGTGRTGQTYYEDATATYDALNRMTSITDTGAKGDRAFSTDYEYDADNNVRHVAATYGSSTQDYWYLYDSMNRFVVTQGTFTGARGTGIIVAGANGTAISYNQAGERVTAVSASSSEAYTYTPDGYLSAVTIGGVLRAEDQRDAMGRLISHTEFGTNGSTVVYSQTSTYDAASLLLRQQTSNLQADGSTVLTSDTTYDYDANNGSGVYNGAYQGGVLVHTQTTNAKISGGRLISQPTSAEVYTYTWTDSAQQASITYQADITKSAVNTSTLSYDANGFVKLDSVYVGSSLNRSISYLTDSFGQVLTRKDSTGAVENYYYFNGKRVGDNGTDGPSATDYTYSTAIADRTKAAATGAFADFSQSYSPIDPASQAEAGASQTYIVRDGDTLQSIAQNFWGDSSLWYMIADANGLSGSQSLIPGQSLTIPITIGNVHNTSSTSRPYDLNQALGDIQPTQVVPPPAKHNHGCGGIGEILVAIVAIVVTAIVMPEAIGAMTDVFAGMGMGAGSAIAGGVVGGAMAGVAGNVASQVVGLTIGVQSKFNWNGVATAAISGAVTGGLGQVSGLQALTQSNPFVGGAVNSAAGSAISQGIDVATGLQRNFDWTNVAVAGIEGGVGGEVAHDLNPTGSVKAYTPQGIGDSLVSGMAGAIAGSAARSLMNGSDFGQNLEEELPSVIGQTIGSAISAKIEEQDSQPIRHLIKTPDDPVVTPDVVASPIQMPVLSTDLPALDNFVPSSGADSSVSAPQGSTSADAEVGLTYDPELKGELKFARFLMQPTDSLGNTGGDVPIGPSSSGSSELPSATAAASTGASVSPGTTSPYTVEVQHGQTLSEIAWFNGISLDALSAANPNITDINSIEDGQLIQIPAGGEMRSAPGVFKNDPDAEIAWLQNKFGATDGPLSSTLQQLAKVLGMGEGNYESYNTGTRGVPGGGVGHSFTDNPDGTVTNMTINEILDTQSLPGTDPNRMFAVGAYQITGNTLRGAVAAMGLTGDELLTPNLQDQIFRDYLVYKAGGGGLANFVINGNGTVNGAQYAAAMEWASVGVPAGYRTQSLPGRPGVISNGYNTYYGGPANRASVSETNALRSFLSNISQSRH